MFIKVKISTAHISLFRIYFRHNIASSFDLCSCSLGVFSAKAMAEKRRRKTADPPIYQRNLNKYVFVCFVLFFFFLTNSCSYWALLPTILWRGENLKRENINRVSC